MGHEPRFADPYRAVTPLKAEEPDWHRSYNDPESQLSRRLDVVKRRLDEALGALRMATPRILSLCAGDGRDVIPVLAARPPAEKGLALLVEKDPVLAQRATQEAVAAGLKTIHVRCGDAADPALYRDWLPVNILLLCGIFGNVSEEDITTTISAISALIASEGMVIWTRGRSQPDLRPRIRSWFTAAGLQEVSFDGDPEPFGVGVASVTKPDPATRLLPQRLFTFLD